MHRPVFLSITTGAAGTAAYSDGVLVKQLSSYKFSSQDLTGQLMFGNAPATADTWSGTLKGFAVYDRELSADETSQHYVSWTHHDEKALANTKGAVGVYLFSENRGSVIRNEVDPGTNLVIPDRFFVPHKQFLETPWDEFHRGWGHWKNLAINVVGFIPLGFFFCALLYSASDLGRPVPATIVVGFAVSLTIEVLQGFLPTRDSGMTDVFSNTLGTALGAIGYTSPAVRHWLGRAARCARVPESFWPSV
jgi:hypothetical protein